MKSLFLNDKFIIVLIVINSLVIFLSGFNFEVSTLRTLEILDDLITLLFLTEIIIKISSYGKAFFKSNWNIFDFVLVAISLPSIVTLFTETDIRQYDFLLVFRVFRVFKSIRFLKFIPGIEHLLRGTLKALKSSIFVLVAFSIYVFIIGILSFSIFNVYSPELFENPLKSIYTIFKIFTIEGWFEIPEAIVSEMSNTSSFFTYAYFIFVVVTGGLFGLSLVNSIFVDAMLEDNNDDLNKKITDLENKIDLLIKEIKK